MNDFNAELLDFLDSAPTAFHAVQQMTSRLADAGFIRLYESENWQVKAGKAYFVTRNDSSIIAFRMGGVDNPSSDSGWRMVGAHTDSPCLKVKPCPDMQVQGIKQLAVEIYGGALLAPWFDRDLSLAGRVSFADKNGHLQSRLINFSDPIASVPSLAIHLDRTANEGRTINKQQELNLVLTGAGGQADDFASLLGKQLGEEYPDLGDLRVMDWEISAYDTQKAAIIGLDAQYLVSARLDNLLSCFIGLKALLEADASQPSLLVCNDHEEVGSQSACGANGPFLRDVLERLDQSTPLAKTLCHSMMISVDNAHALHPNYVDKHDSHHAPSINAGPVIKTNANQRYATNSETSALFQYFCEAADVPLQHFVARNDMGCGSTIGPITSSELGVATIDVGCPQWAMHSIRETAGVKDGYNLKKALVQFYNYS